MTQTITTIKHASNDSRCCNDEHLIKITPTPKKKKKSRTARKPQVNRDDPSKKKTEQRRGSPSLPRCPLDPLFLPPIQQLRRSTSPWTPCRHHPLCRHCPLRRPHHPQRCIFFLGNRRPAQVVGTAHPEVVVV